MKTRIKRYCLCGAALDVSSAPAPTAAQFVAATFDRIHTGEGHGPATQRQAADARRREDRLARLEEGYES